MIIDQVRATLQIAVDDIPTIYADGIHDDTPGWVAAVENRRLIYDGNIYEPDEDITVEREMHFLLKVCCVSAGYQPPHDLDDEWIVAKEPDNSRREVEFLDCRSSD